MQNSSLLEKLKKNEVSITLEHIFENSKAASGGENDVHFLRQLIADGLVAHYEVALKRTGMDLSEEYLLNRYNKMKLESDRHFFCRAMLQEEFKRLGFDSFSGLDVGNMQILRSNSHYDIITEDFQCIIDIGLAPARNFFRGLTDLRTRCYMITSFFDDYMDDVLFSVFIRGRDQDFLDAVKKHETQSSAGVIPEGFPSSDHSIQVQ